MNTILFDRETKRFYTKEPIGDGNIIWNEELIDITDEIVEAIQSNTFTAKLAISWLKDNGYIDENKNWIK